MGVFGNHVALREESLFQRLGDRLVVLEPHSFVGHLLCSVTQVCQEEEKRVVIVYMVPSATPERSRWLEVPGGRRNGAIRLSVACEKQKHLPEWRLVQQQGSQQQQMISALSRQWHSHPLGNCCCGRSIGNLGKISLVCQTGKKRAMKARCTCAGVLTTHFYCLITPKITNDFKAFLTRIEWTMLDAAKKKNQKIN